MKYQGSKNRIAKHILPIMLKDRKEGQYWVEPFVGGANIIDKVTGNRIGADANESLIMCLDSLSNGWVPPKSISRDEYNKARKSWQGGDNSNLIGYIGINGSYGGRWFDGGYAGVSKTKSGGERDYPMEAFENTIKQAPALKGIKFLHSDYQDLIIPPKSIIYCDPPYEGTKEYLLARKSGFKSEEFWQWCKEKSKEGHTVFVSEYNAPDDFICIWQKEFKSSLSANGLSGGSKKHIEKLFVHESELVIKKIYEESK